MEKEGVDERDIKIAALEEQLALLRGLNEEDDEVSKLRKCISKLMLRLQEKDFELRENQSILKQKSDTIERRADELEFDYQCKSNYDKSLITVMSEKVTELSEEIHSIKMENGSYDNSLPVNSTITDPEVLKFMKNLTKYMSSFDIKCRTLKDCVTNASELQEKGKFMKDFEDCLKRHEKVLITLRSLSDCHQQVYYSYLMKHMGLFNYHHEIGKTGNK